ncbi:Vegetative incompatibility protein HET-E-1 [Colletotrichum orbiculare MAFF 240422]|uniref:Vegetative incompatibility protein HET-E-1 n=1 Tax=Colletotrichum orbiculare (strain 104-T / ATCC 96160 / CBS 514.97 / LARS 414 / MAFF 240422) TaxID=1213857 RepID=A0A484FE92_COLOR|nr:Vegetative incompatibility protein HET-E-1 [Colletotrichum orbiculare MAFF 240422]
MAEAFGLAASVFATIQIADRVISLCKQYIQGVKEARADLRAILVETSTIKATLETVKSVIDLDAGQSDSLSGLEGPLGPVESCRKAIAELEELLASASRATPSGSKRRKIQATYENLAWPFKREKARGLLEELAMQKSTITLTLTADSLLVMKDIQESTGRIQQMLTDSDRRDVYTWLQHTDPSTIHHRACDNYEKGTCDWPSKLPEWDDFLQGKTRCLWIHGIPGAGKTILASQLIERLEEHCESFNTERTTSLYYYCYFGHNQDEAIPFLKWLLSRLCRRAESIPKLLWKLFKRGDTPSLTNFLITIEHALEHFDTVYVTIDALDESQSRGNLLKVVRDLMTDFRFSKIHLLATSREYLDIEKVMEPISMEVSMKNPFLDDDIRTYTVACINREGRMMSWTQQLRDETVEALVEGAKGMFRWVVCQVDMLKRVRGNGDAIREELRRLPKTLDETYTRIFDQIPKEDAMFVDVALGWMYFCHYLNDGRFLRRDLTLRIEVLANAVQWEVARASARGPSPATTR